MGRLRRTRDPAVNTVPFELRARLAYDGKLLSAVGRIFIDSMHEPCRGSARRNAGTP
jgi:hypothetical protein